MKPIRGLFSFSLYFINSCLTDICGVILSLERMQNKLLSTVLLMRWLKSIVIFSLSLWFHFHNSHSYTKVNVYGISVCSNRIYIKITMIYHKLLETSSFSSLLLYTPIYSYIFIYLFIYLNLDNISYVFQNWISPKITFNSIFMYLIFLFIYFIFSIFLIYFFSMQFNASWRLKLNNKIYVYLNDLEMTLLPASFETLWTVLLFVTHFPSHTWWNIKHDTLNHHESNIQLRIGKHLKSDCISFPFLKYKNHKRNTENKSQCKEG